MDFRTVLIFIIIAELAILIDKINLSNNENNCDCTAKNDTERKPVKRQNRILKSPSRKALERFRDNGY